MKKLSIFVDFKNEKLMWNNVIVLMWISGANNPNHTLNRSKINQVMKQTSYPRVTKEATEIIVKKSDSKYEKANLK